MSIVSNGFLCPQIPTLPRFAGLILMASLVGGCVEESPTYATDIQSVQVQGGFLAPDNADPEGIWVGSETVEAFGAGGLLCEREWQMEAVEVDVDGGCLGCSVTLQVVSSVGEAAGTECAEALEGLGRVHDELPSVAYAPGLNGVLAATEGTVYLLNEIDVQWDIYSEGVYDGVELIYTHGAPSIDSEVFWSSGIGLGDPGPSGPAI